MPQAAIAAGLAIGNVLGLSGAATVGLATVLGTAAASPLVVGLTLSAGSLLVQRALTPGASIQTPPSIPPEAKGNFRQSAPAQRVIYGTQRAAGPLFFLDDTHPPFLYWGVLLSARRVSDFRTVNVGGNTVTFDPTGAALTEGYVGKFWASFRDGDPDQAIDALLDADFPDLPTTFRQRGHATAVFKADFGADSDEHGTLWGSNTLIPNATIEVDGAPVYDPRDASQNRDDEETWKFSRVAALIEADYLRADYGGRVPADQIDWDKIARAAEHDNSGVGTKSEGLQQRYLLDGIIAKNQSPIDVMEGMLLCNRAFIGWTQGSAWVQSAEKREPVMTIHDKMLVGGFEYNAARPRKSVLNKVRTRFAPPERDYQSVDGPVYSRDDLEDDDQELLETALPLDWVTRHQQAQRIAKAALDESRLGPAIALTCNLDALALEAGDAVRLDSRLFASIQGLNRIYTIEEQGFAEDFSRISLNLAAYDGDIEGDWHPADDEADFEIEDIEL